MWDVVLWSDTKTVGLVPSCWANATNTMYKYPTSKDKNLIEKLIKDCPELSDNYQWRTAKVKLKGMKNRNTAAEYCSEVQFYESLITRVEDEEHQTEPGPCKAAQKRKRSYSSDSDVECVTAAGVLLKKVNSNGF